MLENKTQQWRKGMGCYDRKFQDVIKISEEIAFILGFERWEGSVPETSIPRKGAGQTGWMSSPLEYLEYRTLDIWPFPRAGLQVFRGSNLKCKDLFVFSEASMYNRHSGALWKINHLCLERTVFEQKWCANAIYLNKLSEDVRRQT